MFHNVVEDDRSDNDENELAEEQRLDALAHQARLDAEKAAEKTESPHLLVNGEPLSGKAQATGAESRANGTTNRKANGRKS